MTQHNAIRLDDFQKVFAEHIAATDELSANDIQRLVVDYAETFTSDDFRSADMDLEVAIIGKPTILHRLNPQRTVTKRVIIRHPQLHENAIWIDEYEGGGMGIEYIHPEFSQLQFVKFVMMCRKRCLGTLAEPNSYFMDEVVKHVNVGIGGKKDGVISHDVFAEDSVWFTPDDKECE